MLILPDTPVIVSSTKLDARSNNFSIAFLILAHNNFVHLKWLCTSLLADPRSKVFVHVDAKAGSIQDIDLPTETVLLENRQKVYWGDFSIIETTYLCLEQIRSIDRKIDYFVLLSGVDFPIQPISRINDYFANNRYKLFMDADVLPNGCFDKPIELLTWNCDRPSLSRSRLGARWALKKLRLIQRERDYKKVFGNIQPFSGSQWWAMPRSGVQYLLEWRKANKSVYGYFENVTCPEETLFQTALMNSKFKNDICSYVTYCDWSDGPPHPVKLTESHITLFNSGELRSNNNSKQPAAIYQFARKFDDSSLALISKLSSYVDQ